MFTVTPDTSAFERKIIEVRELGRQADERLRAGDPVEVVEAWRAELASAETLAKITHLHRVES